MRDTSGNKCMKILSQKTFENEELGKGRFRGRMDVGTREFFAYCWLFLIIREIFVEHTPML